MIGANLAVYDSKFYWESDTPAMFVQCQCKAKKSVDLLSTMQRLVSCRADEKRKPTVIAFYNVNKVIAAWDPPTSHQCERGWR